MRDAISLLDQMLSFDGAEVVTLAQVQEVLGAVSSQAVVPVRGYFAQTRCRRRAQAHPATGAGWVEPARIHAPGGRASARGDGRADDRRRRADHRLPGDTVRQMQSQAQQVNLPPTLFAVKRFGEALPKLKGGDQPQLPLELALVEAIQGGPAAPVVVQQVVQQVVQAPAATAPATAAPVQAAHPAQAAQPDAAQPAEAPLDAAAVQRLRTLEGFCQRRA